EDGIRDDLVTGVQTCALPISYTATKGNLAGLDARFKDHTIKLFEKHGMTNLIYWHLAADNKDADKMLIYMLAHKSEGAAKKSFRSEERRVGKERRERMGAGGR